jgi:superfamily II DNA/RNA helicase
MDDAESYKNEGDSEAEEENNSKLTDLGCIQATSDVSSHSTTDYPEKKLYALVLTPTRELAMQVHKHLTAAAQFTDIKVSCRQVTVM